MRPIKNTYTCLAEKLGQALHFSGDQLIFGRKYGWCRKRTKAVILTFSGIIATIFGYNVQVEGDESKMIFWPFGGKKQKLRSLHYVREFVEIESLYSAIEKGCFKQLSIRIWTKNAGSHKK